MEYHFSAVAKPTYLHVTGSGTHSLDNIRRFFADVNVVHMESHLDALLVELRFVGPSLNIGEAYSIMVENRAIAARLTRFAYVDTNVEHLPERAEFVELAAQRMGVNVRAFRNVAAAEKWLSEE